MDTDKATTALGGSAAVAILTQISFAQPGWWKQLVAALAIAALGYLTNKGSRQPPMGPPPAGPATA